jgi:serine/threonine protein kinase
MLGDTLSHYQILDRLGRSGMGVIYRAVDTMLGRQVALKFLPDGISLVPASWIGSRAKRGPSWR